MLKGLKITLYETILSSFQNFPGKIFLEFFEKIFKGKNLLKAKCFKGKTKTYLIKKMIDALGEILTEKEIKFLSEILYEAWFSLDVRNMSNEKRRMYSSIKRKIAILNNRSN